MAAWDGEYGDDMFVMDGFEEMPTHVHRGHLPTSPRTPSSADDFGQYHQSRHSSFAAAPPPSPLDALGTSWSSSAGTMSPMEISPAAHRDMRRGHQHLFDDGGTGVHSPCRSISMPALAVPFSPKQALPKFELEQLVNSRLQHTDYVERATLALAEYPPTLAEEGEGGTWIMYDSNGEAVAVFKPVDEEPFAANNPKHAHTAPTAGVYCSSSIESLKLIKPGDGAAREVAAFILDHSSRARVPATVMAEFDANYFSPTGRPVTRAPMAVSPGVPVPKPSTDVKLGSLQRFVEHTCSSWEIGPVRFNADDVHSIGLLDLRILNLDRHGGNILVVDDLVCDVDEKPRQSLIPIDHAFCLPPHQVLENIPMLQLWFEWLNWPQAKQPFSSDTIAALHDIDIDMDVKRLKPCSLPAASLVLHRLCHEFVILCVDEGLTLYDIGIMVCRHMALTKCYRHAKAQQPMFAAFSQQISKPSDLFMEAWQDAAESEIGTYLREKRH